MTKPILLFGDRHVIEELTKSQVEGYTRADGTYVKPHTTKVQAAAPKQSLRKIKPKGGDIGAGMWRVGHMVKIHAPGRAVHGTSGKITGPNSDRRFVNVKTSDGQTLGLNSDDIRPADGYGWPDLDYSQPVRSKKK